MRRHIIIKPEVGPASLFPSTAPAVVSSAVRQTAKMHLQSASPKSVLYQVSFWALCLRAKNLASVQVLVDFKHACAQNSSATTQHNMHSTRRPIFLCYCAHFSGLCCDEQPRKTALGAITHDNTLTVPESLFRRDSLPVSMHGCIESTTIKLNHFWARPYTDAHFCGTSTQTSGHLSSRQQGERGTADKRWQL